MLLLILLPSLLLLLAPGHGEAAAASATVSLKTVSSWNGGSQVSVVIKNTGTMAICAATFRLTLPSGTTVSSSWNMQAAGGGGGQFSLPGWVNIPPGGSSSDPGLVLSGGGSPSVSIVSAGACGGGGGGTTTTTTTTTTKPPGTTTKPPGPLPTDPNAGSVSLGGIQQTIDGWGASSAWQTVSDVAMDALYGNNGPNQIGLSIIRLRIDPNKNWAQELSNAKRAAARGAIVMATPWTPPASMKTNQNTVGGSLNPSSYGAYADYLKSFVDYMAQNGVRLYTISVQNEPDITVTYESCDWTAAQLISFLSGFRQRIGSTKVMAAESFQFRTALTDPILNNPASASQVDIVAGHIYGGGLANYALARSKGKQVWMTEHYVAGNSWSTNMEMAKEIHDCMTVANYNAYFMWWFVTTNDPGPLDNGQTGKVSSRGYIMGQFAKFIRPGYQRVDATYSPRANVYLSAYKGGGKVVIVVINTGFSDVNQQINIGGGSAPASFTPYVTSPSKQISTEASVSVSGGKFSYTLSAQSVTTFVSN